MSNISIQKLRNLPYHDRLKFVMMRPNWFQEIEQMLRDYPDWDHYEIENRVVYRGNLIECSELIRNKNVDSLRMVKLIADKFIKTDDANQMEYLVNKNFGPLFRILGDLPRNDDNDLAANWIAQRIEQVYITEMESKRHFVKKDEFTDLFDTGITGLIDIITSKLGKEKIIDTNILIRTMLKYIDDPITMDTIIMLKRFVTDPSLLRDIQDHLMVHDILT